VLSGPSGVGKTTLCKKILENCANVRYSVSATSRPKRRVEEEGREYIFLSKKAFENWISKGLFIEYAEVHGNFYGTPKKYLEDNLNKGLHVLMDVDVQGAKILMELYPAGLYFFIIPPDVIELEKRLQKRNTEKSEVIKHRLKRAMEELKYKNDYKYVIENRDLEETLDSLVSIIKKEIGG
jgi:guanylate kinase